MPHRRFDWHEHIKDIEAECRAVRIAVDRLKEEIVLSPDLFRADNTKPKHLREADNNLEGTYLVRLFAAFEAALRSYDRARHNDPARNEIASVLIDTTGGRRGQGISTAVRDGAHEVRRVRNYWAHETTEIPAPMTLAQARSRLQRFLSWLPDEWD
jgi:hypothetical protein